MGLFFPPPSIILYTSKYCVVFSLLALGGVSRPRSGALVAAIYLVVLFGTDHLLLFLFQHIYFFGSKPIYHRLHHHTTHSLLYT